MTPKQKMNKKYPTKGNKEYYHFVHDLDVYSKPIRQAEKKEEQKKEWESLMSEKSNLLQLGSVYGL